MRKAEIRRTRLMRRGQVPGVLVVTGKADELNEFEAAAFKDDLIKETLGAGGLEKRDECPLPNPVIYASQNDALVKADLTAKGQTVTAEDLHGMYHDEFSKLPVHTRRYRLAAGLDAEQAELTLRTILKARGKFESLDIYLDSIFRASQGVGSDSPSLREPAVGLPDANIEQFGAQSCFSRIGFAAGGQATGKGVTVVILDTSPEVEKVCHKAVDFWIDLSYGNDHYPPPLPHEKDIDGVEEPKLNSVKSFKARNRNRKENSNYLPNDAMQPYHGLVIATMVRHIVPDATIVLVKALDPNGEAAGSTLTHALELVYYLKEAKVEANGRRVVEDKLIYNLSFGLFRTQSEEVDAAYMLNTCDYLCTKGALIVAASGNNSFRRHPENPQEPSAYGYFSDTPATNTNVIAVAATSDKETDYAWFSNRSNLAAPGFDLMLDVGEFTKGAPTRFVQWSGSSFAAPIVAACAAALLSTSPTFESNKVKEVLWRTATPPTDWNGVPEVNLGKALAG